jgi:uncharacterized membrane protein YgcG
MKKILIVIFGIFFFASLAFGDEVDRDLSKIANEQIRTHTRAMVNAGIHRDEALKMTRMMIQRNYQNQNTIRAQQILIATVKESLPVKPVMNKAFEGIAKNAPEDLVVQAMEKTRYRYSIAYKHARQITKNTNRMHNIAKAIAEGFTAGIHNTDTVQVMNKLKSRTQQRTKANTEELAEESFLLLRDMARPAKDVVCHAHNQQYSAQEMKQLRHLFMSQSMSTNPVKLANQYSYAISRGVRAENLSSNQAGKHTQTEKTDDQKGAGDSGAGSGGSDGSGGSSGGSDGSGGGSGGSDGSGGGSD